MPPLGAQRKRWRRGEEFYDYIRLYFRESLVVRDGAIHLNVPLPEHGFEMVFFEET